MNRGKDPPRSLCEKRFTLEAIKENKRLDGREVYDYRELSISLGEEPGHVEVRLGGTRVLARVTGQVVQPKAHRPTDGQLFFNVELSPMASPAFEVGRPSSYATEITRILERCIKDSRAVDTETLCIIAGEKVWEIRLDLHVLDHCGNIIDCASIAAITALKHFRRPDVTVIGEEATVHPVSERDPVPLSVHHIPLCFTFAFFLDGEYLLVDPTLSEEAVMEGRMVVGMNIHREICALQMSGGVALLPELVVRCTQIAAAKCVEITEIIKKALNEKSDQTMEIDSILRTKKPKEKVSVPEVPMDEEGEGEAEPMAQEESNKPKVTLLGEGTAELGMGGVSTWETVDQYQWTDNEEDKETRSNKKPAAKTTATPSNTVKDQNISNKRESSTKTESDVIEIKSDSEEEETVVLTKEDVNGAAKTEAPAGASLSELVALESQKEVTELSEGVKELSTEPCEQATAPVSSATRSRQRKGKGRKGDKKDSASPVDVEVVGATQGGGGGGGGKVKGGGQRTNSGAGSSSNRSRGRRRKSNTKTH